MYSETHVLLKIFSALVAKTRVSESYGAIDQMILYMMVVESHAVSFPIGSKYCMPCVSSHPIGSEHASVPCAQSSSR
jgi:hypothetical protein